MPYIYLILSLFMSSSSSVFGKLYNRRNAAYTNAGPLYNCILMISVFLGWFVLFCLDSSFDAGVLLYSLLFATCYTGCMFGIILSLRHGPAALTSLATGLSLILTTIWGFIFWDSRLTAAVALGLVLVVISIVLCLCSGKTDKKAISLKWLFYASLAFFGNAGCSIVQRTQQMLYGGEHGNMLMMAAVGVSALVCLGVFLKSDKTDARKIAKTSWWIPVLAGICNLILNVCVMRLALTALSPSLIYPVIGVGGLSVVTLFSLFVFKEKMLLRQWIGIGIGAIAVALLSL